MDADEDDDERRYDMTTGPARVVTPVRSGRHGSAAKHRRIMLQETGIEIITNGYSCINYHPTERGPDVTGRGPNNSRRDLVKGEGSEQHLQPAQGREGIVDIDIR